MRDLRSFAVGSAIVLLVFTTYGPVPEGEASTACFSTHTFGTGVTGFDFCISNHGNIVQFACPEGDEHIRVKHVLLGGNPLFRPREGYILCASGGPYFDIGFGESGWQAPVITQPNGPNTFPLTICRTTTDGNWTLCQQGHSRNTTEKELRFQMKLTNNTGSTQSATLERYFDGDLDGGGEEDIYDRSGNSVWGRDRSSDNHNGMMLTTLSYQARVTTAVEPFPGTNTTCGAAATSVPTIPDGDFIGKLGFQFFGPATTNLLGSFGPGKSKTVTIQYQCK